MLREPSSTPLFALGVPGTAAVRDFDPYH